MGLLNLFTWRQPNDQAPPIEEDLAPEFAADEIDEAALHAAGRRERNPNDGLAVVENALSVKLLHAWLQNRHQTLVPLTINVATLSAERRAALARMLASFLLVGRSSAEAKEAAPELRRWLGGVGGDDGTLDAYDQALTSPLPLNVAFDTAQAHDLTIYAYVAALMASDSRYHASVSLCDLVQARFDLPSAVVRSAVRRYRR